MPINDTKLIPIEPLSVDGHQYFYEFAEYGVPHSEYWKTPRILNIIESVYFDREDSLINSKEQWFKNLDSALTDDDSYMLYHFVNRELTFVAVGNIVPTLHYGYILQYYLLAGDSRHTPKSYRAMKYLAGEILGQRVMCRSRWVKPYTYEIKFVEL